MKKGIPGSIQEKQEPVCGSVLGAGRSRDAPANLVPRWPHAMEQAVCFDQLTFDYHGAF